MLLWITDLEMETACVHPLPDSVEELQDRQTCADLDSHLDQVDIMVGIPYGKSHVALELT